MNHKIQLLDCTLRDGGYVNDWNFGRDTTAYLFERLVSSKVDIIEVGFMDERRVYDPDRTIMPNSDAVEKNFAKFDHGNAMLVGMIDFGTCSIENVKPCAESCLDGIRVIFKKEKMYPAMAFCKQVKALGYKVFSQLVSVTSYTDDELREVIGLVNDCHPYAVSMVDTYGLCDAPTLAHIVSIIDKELAPDIALGYHAHNNFQLAYSNAISVLNLHLDRDVLVDGTLYGMGKSAGNAPLELLAMYMNAQFGKQYDVNQIQEAISTSILDLYHKKPWGYTLFYYIAASNRCHPDYVSYLMNKRTLSVTAVNEILQQIPEEKKLGKDMKMIESLYLEYEKKECDDTKALQTLQEELSHRKLLVMGPGASVSEQEIKIANYIAENKPVVIAINYIPKKFHPRYLFLTNARRYLQMSGSLTQQDNAGIRIVATSNVTRTGGDFPLVLNYSNLIDESQEFPDNSMMMMIRLLMEIGVKEVALAGFDGYTPDDVNYFDANMEYSFVKEKADGLNESGRAFFQAVKDKLDVKFVTKSYYQE